jgi:hypothetical protein
VPEPGPSASSAPRNAEIRLLVPGKPPRRKLRYVWNRKQGETLTIDLKTTATTESEGERPPEMPLPPVHIVIAIQPAGVTPDGDLHYAWHVTSTDVIDTPASPPQLAEGMRAEVAAVARLAGEATVTSRGLARQVSVEPASVIDAGTTGQMVEQVRQTLRDLAAPFPEEEVGIGGRWEKLSQLVSRDAIVTQTETFLLSEEHGDTGALEDVLAQTAPPQALAGAGAESAKLESMLASGASKMRFDLHRLVPFNTFDGTTTMVVSGHAPGDNARRMTMIMRVGIALSGSRP